MIFIDFFLWLYAKTWDTCELGALISLWFVSLKVRSLPMAFAALSDVTWTSGEWLFCHKTPLPLSNGMVKTWCSWGFSMVCVCVCENGNLIEIMKCDTVVIISHAFRTAIIRCKHDMFLTMKSMNHWSKATMPLTILRCLWQSLMPPLASQKSVLVVCQLPSWHFKICNRDLTFGSSSFVHLKRSYWNTMWNVDVFFYHPKLAISQLPKHNCMLTSLPVCDGGLAEAH